MQLCNNISPRHYLGCLCRGLCISLQESLQCRRHSFHYCRHVDFFVDERSSSGFSGILLHSSLGSRVLVKSTTAPPPPWVPPTSH